LPLLGSLPRVEEYESPVRTPGDRVAAAVGDEADGLRLAVAVHARDEDVAEELLADGQVGYPAAVGRPDERAVGAERRSLQHARRDHALLLRLQVERANLPARALERYPLAVGREARRVVSFSARGQLRLGVGGEVVEEELTRAVAPGDVCEAAAVGRPGGLRLGGGAVRDARRVAAVGRGGREDFAARDEGDLLAVGRERQVLKLIREPQALDRRPGGDAAPRDADFARAARLRVQLPDSEAALEDDCPPVVRDARPEHAPVRELSHL